VVTIIIGPEDSQETFVVHKDLICHYSPFFSNAFNSNFTESATKTITSQMSTSITSDYSSTGFTPNKSISTSRPAMPCFP
jgi:hypothetical protein